MKLDSILLEWYDKHRRDLPWRGSIDPYRVWVSEVMLQQTRVEAARPYYERWLERFPTMAALAEASEEEVLSYWQGLGYYSRARNLHQGVREVVASYGGKVPDTKAAISTLAGVGDYTAGAILSISYNKREPAVDGNVLRVFSRLFSIDSDITRPSTRREIATRVHQEMSIERPGDFNQAIMDLGASVCIPRNPRCELCPLSACCIAYCQGRQLELPVRRKSPPPVAVYLATAIVEEEGKFLLHKRPSKGILANMWEFPTIKVDDCQTEQEQLRATLAEWGQSVRVLPSPMTQLVHTFSHRQWYLSFYRCQLLQSAVLEMPKDTMWLAPNEWHTVSFAGPHGKMADLLRK